MTSVKVTTVSSEVIVTPTNNRVSIQEIPAVVNVTQQESSVLLSEIKNQVVIANAPTLNTVTVQQPATIKVVVQTSDISESKILDLARTDASDATLSYTDGKLTSVIREGFRKDITYNEDGTVNTVTLTTNFGTVVKTFSYNQNGLTSITVT